MPTELIQLGLGMLVLGLLFGAWVQRRARVESQVFWPLAWAVLVFAGIGRALSAPPQLDYLVGALFPTLILAGALRYADREVPRWLIPGGIGVGAFHLILDGVGQVSLARSSAEWIEPMGFAVAAYVAHRATRGARVSPVHRLVAPGILLLLGIDVWDARFAGDRTAAIGVNLVVGIPVATVQAVAMFDRIRTRADGVARALEQSISLLQASIESTRDGILVVDRERKYTTFNRAFGEMWRIPLAILEIRDSETVLDFARQQLKDPDAFYEKAQSIYAQPELETFDTLEFKDGRIFERYSRPQRVGAEIVGRVWSFRDVTERVRAEAMATRYQNHLEELVEERTRELLESRDRLRQADRLVAVGTLAAGVAHQINNPVGSILNSAEYALMCEEDVDAKAIWKRALEVNAAEARRCAEIVRSMLQFAREEPVAKQVEDVNQIVRRSCRATEHYARQCGARVDVVLSQDPLMVEVSPIEIEQVFVNLLRNAMESRESGVVVEVRSQRKAGLARVGVTDNGHGIDPDHANRIFDPFFSTRIQSGGTGLGLSVAHGIVSDHGGEIRVSSECGKGTAIVVELPICSDSPPRS